MHIIYNQFLTWVVCPPERDSSKFLGGTNPMKKLGICNSICYSLTTIAWANIEKFIKNAKAWPSHWFSIVSVTGLGNSYSIKKTKNIYFLKSGRIFYSQMKWGPRREGLVPRGDMVIKWKMVNFFTTARRIQSPCCAFGSSNHQKF